MISHFIKFCPILLFRYKPKNSKIQVYSLPLFLKGNFFHRGNIQEIPSRKNLHDL
eukprot:UN03404